MRTNRKWFVAIKLLFAIFRIIFLETVKIPQNPHDVTVIIDICLFFGCDNHIVKSHCDLIYQIYNVEEDLSLSYSIFFLQIFFHIKSFPCMWYIAFHGELTIIICIWYNAILTLIYVSIIYLFVKFLNISHSIHHTIVLNN